MSEKERIAAEEKENTQKFGLSAVYFRETAASIGFRVFLGIVGYDQILRMMKGQTGRNYVLYK